MILSEWLHSPRKYSVKENTMEIQAAENTNYFEDPLTHDSFHNAPFFYTRIKGDFTFTCRITPNFHATYDAGGLFLYSSPTHWVKFAFEKTDLGCTSVVTVVTDRKSDDANGEQISTKGLTMRMSRKKDVIGTYFYSESAWRMTRMFPFSSINDEQYLGIIAQSPVGDGCRVVYEDMELVFESVKDFRKGK